MEISTTVWLAIILVYGIAMLLIGLYIRQKKPSQEWFLVGNRKVGWKLMAFSIAASWIWHRHYLYPVK